MAIDAKSSTILSLPQLKEQHLKIAPVYLTRDTPLTETPALALYDWYSFNQAINAR